MYIDLWPGQTCHSKDSGSAYSIGVGEFGWQYEAGLKSHGTITNWCTRREWLVNCMTVISARWWSNMRFQRRWKCIFRWPIVGGDWVGVELLYNSVKTGSQAVWRPDQLVKRCSRESQHPAEGALRLPINERFEIREMEKWGCRENSTQ